MIENGTSLFVCFAFELYTGSLRFGLTRATNSFFKARTRRLHFSSECLALKRAPHAGLLSLPTSEYLNLIALV
jgi:hypothetical protein